MNGAVLDNELSDGLALMAESRWAEAQQILADRLRSNSEADQKRLTYFLLSITAASGGQSDIGDKLWAKAQTFPLGELTARYLDLQLAPNDPRQAVLIDLERAWWEFNGWNSAAPLSIPKEEVNFDWELALHCARIGTSQELESKYGQCFDEQNSQTAILWNLLALSYLEAGNVRTYEEMVQNRPAPPTDVPSSVRTLFESNSLEQALAKLESGQWLRTADLTADADAFEASVGGLSEDQWLEGMANGIAFIDLTQLLEAGRAFQATCQVEDQTKRTLSLNALSLSFFKLGDYTQAETVYHEFKMLLEQNPIDPDSALAVRYRGWLESVESAPENGQLFFSPFGTKADWGSEIATEETLDFNESFSNVLHQISQSELSSAKRELQKMEQQLVESETNKRYLVTLCYLASAVLAGDHFEVQEFEVELNNFRSKASFTSTELQETADTLKWAGFEQAAAALTSGDGGTLGILNPWQDFTVAQTESFDAAPTDNDWDEF